MDRRLNIGLMIDDPDNYFSGQACKGAELAAKAMDANLFIFPGHYIGKADGRYENREYEYQPSIRSTYCSFSLELSAREPSCHFRWSSCQDSPRFR